jgi:ABC-2 type transport system permease protein
MTGSWTQTRQLLGIRWAMVRNDFARPTRAKCLRWSLMLGLGALLLWGEYVFFLRIIRHVDGLPLNVGEELMVQIFNVVFLTLFAMILFSSLISTLNVFYLSNDMEFLHALPLRQAPIVGVRFLQNLAQSSLMALLFSLPIFLAYGVYFKLSGGFFAYLLAAFFPFVVLPCAVGTLAIMVLMRYFPTKKTHQILSLLGLFFIVGLILYLRFLSPEKFFGKDVQEGAIIAFVESLRAPDYRFLPSSWITAGLIDWRAGKTAEAGRELTHMLVATAVVLGVLYEVSGRIYFSGWRQMQELNTAPARNNNADLPGSSIWERLPGSPADKALLAKDVKIFFRDPGQWSQLFVLFALVVVYIFNIANLPVNNPFYGLGFRSVLSVLNIGLVGFVLSALISRFVFPATSLEGLKMWTIYTAPVDMRRFLQLKWLLCFPPLFFLAELLVVISNILLGVDDYVMGVSAIMAFLLSIGLVGMGVGMGAVYPQFHHENVTEISTSAGGIMYMIASLLYVGLVLALAARPMYAHFTLSILDRRVGDDSLYYYGLILALTVLAALVPFRCGVRALKSMDL